MPGREPKRVLVTGGAGFIGSRAVAALQDRGYDVHAPRRNLLDSAAVDEVVRAARPTHLLHLAWYSVPGKLWAAPENDRWMDATLRLFRAFYDAGGTRAVGAGTCAEYDWSAGGVLSERWTPLRPATRYGEAKAKTFMRAAGMGALAWGRVFFPYGPGERPDRLVPAVTRALLAGEQAPDHAGAQVRDFMHVDDVGGAFAALVDSGVTGAVNIGSGRRATVSDAVGEIARAVGRPELVRDGADLPGENEPPELVADVRRLREEVGFEPSFGLREGLEDTVRWWRGRL